MNLSAFYSKLDSEEGAAAANERGEKVSAPAAASIGLASAAVGAVGPVLVLLVPRLVLLVLLMPLMPLFLLFLTPMLSPAADYEAPRALVPAAGTYIIPI